ncbi:hypothetical protein ES288_D04G158100v1 [Gossypium darwinii]|uniref:Retrotransposon Copia-like N-terminal domain-containing protein n=2 Tax=Gossypium TaxID=3633 RepID=A0A5D2LDR1_GOSTO|nr:hypothetical protein ES288_D04G158100v1 [Gossypium darwinii]TYH77521.1 hypothetical protein ES332_D04G159900v1 [Gossypium tomentosum]
METGSIDPALRKEFNPVTFVTQKVVTFIDDNTFLAWKQHVLLIIKTHHLQSYIDGSIVVPPQEILGDDNIAVENPTFIHFEQQDSALSAWLFSIVCTSLHIQLIGCSSSAFELW